jgi:hypothetical protein
MPSSSGWSLNLRAILSLITLGWAACANESPPPGTLPDARPPQVEQIVPGRDTIVPGFDGDARVRFDEPATLSNIERELVASPDESYEVKVGFSDVRMRPRGGWRDGVIYCLELPDGIRDLRNNPTQEPIEFCFSTGPPIPSTRVTGMILNALTDQPQAQARVHFLALPDDSTRYAAQVDGEGVFERRALPPGTYWAFGFVDQNRNLLLDRQLEPYDSVRLDLPPDGSADLEFRLTDPDTTPARLVQAVAVDSLTLRLEFDDPLQHTQPGQPSVKVTETGTGVTVDVVAALIGEPAQVRFPALPGGETPEEEPEEQLEPSPGRGLETVFAGSGELPSQAVSVRLAVALKTGTYRVQASGFVNLRDLVGGGDTTFVYEASAPDSADVSPGETGEPPAPDTARASGGRPRAPARRDDL